MNSFFVNTLVMNSLAKYITANKRDKSKIIDNIINNTSLHRKSVIRKLHKLINTSPKARGGSKSKYNSQTNEILKLIWESRDFICAELLHPYLPESIKYLRQYNHLDTFTAKDIELVESMPLGTLKLKLKQLNVVRPNFSYYRRTGMQLKKIISVNTAMNQAKIVGFLELDFVDHNGGDASGQFARTLCCTDIFSQFIVRKATQGKAEQTVQTVFDKVLQDIPFTILALHTDNEPSLLKSMILQETKRNGIRISRSRSYQKQDNGHVEQKNGDKIRLLVGYKRYDSDEQVEYLNRLYETDDLLQNHFIPSRRLVEKIYDDKFKLITKKWDIAKTPYQRILNDKKVDIKIKFKLMLLHQKLNPLELKMKRDYILKELRGFRVTR